MHKDIQKKARAFVNKHRLKKVNFTSVRSAAKAEGYTIVEFNHLYNDKDVNVLVEALHLKEYVSTAKGFTYADNNYRIIFLHEDLSDSEKVLVLLHELGHITLGHLTANSIIGNDVMQEYEANEFSHYITHRSKMDAFFHSACWNKKWYITGGVLLVAVLVLLLTFCTGQTPEQPSGIAPDNDPVQTEVSVTNPTQSTAQPAPSKTAPYAEKQFFITATGKKYHLEDCRYLQDKSDVSPMTKEQYDSGFYQPCAYCKP
ncbi:MAG: ImmA/IrrE family metallo-endopeptidase [Clostridia bacterium]|nr:ImmA/IrrE family metallo-endopeptidase [Clostridia bacterium]